MKYAENNKSGIDWVVRLLLLLQTWALVCVFGEIRHRIERLEELQGLPQDRSFWLWPWDQEESRIKLDIPRQQETPHD